MGDDDYLLRFTAVFFLVYLLFLTTLVLSGGAGDLFVDFFILVGHRALFLTSDFDILDLLTALWRWNSLLVVQSAGGQTYFCQLLPRIFLGQ